VSKIRLALVGLGKIARDQHLPSIAADPRFELVAIVSRNADLDGVAHFTTLADLLASDVGVDAVSLCTPPQPRPPLAHLASVLRAGTATGEFHVEDPDAQANLLYATALGALQLVRVGLLHPKGLDQVPRPSHSPPEGVPARRRQTSRHASGLVAAYGVSCGPHAQHNRSSRSVGEQSLHPGPTASN
jgi:hypothetical protein